MLYEIKCTECEETFDVICSVKDRDAGHTCPKCGAIGERHIALTANMKLTWEPCGSCDNIAQASFGTRGKW